MLAFRYYGGVSTETIFRNTTFATMYLYRKGYNKHHCLRQPQLQLALIAISCASAGQLKLDVDSDWYSKLDDIISHDVQTNTISQWIFAQHSLIQLVYYRWSVIN